MKMKKTNAVKLAKELGKHPTTVTKAISGKSLLASDKLKDAIVEALQPDLDRIHYAYSLPLDSVLISPEARLGLLSRES